MKCVVTVLLLTSTLLAKAVVVVKTAAAKACYTISIEKVKKSSFLFSRSLLSMFMIMSPMHGSARRKHKRNSRYPECEKKNGALGLSHDMKEQIELLLILLTAHSKM